jgi:hypothetical protein
MSIKEKNKIQSLLPDSALNVTFILLFILSLGFMIWGNIHDWTKLHPGPTYGFAGTRLQNIVDGCFLFYLGALLLSSYCFTNLCSFFQLIMHIFGTRRGAKNPIMLICGVVAFILGLATFFG